MEKSEGVSTSSSDKSYLKEGDKIDISIVCECGGI